MREEWRDVVGLEGMYQVSNYGNVRSVDRFVNNKSNTKTKIKGVVMKLQENHKGYMAIVLHKNNVPISKLVHRLVAEAFLENTNNLPQVNHIDTDKKNNRVDNLEWVSNYDNMQHAVKNGCYKHAFTEKTKLAVQKNLNYARKARIRSVRQYDNEGNLVNEFESIADAERKTGVNNSKITMCCKHRRNHAGGYVWKYVEEM